MKIIAVTNNNQNNPGDAPEWVFLPDSCIVRSGNPFFVPDLSPHTDVCATLALRIGKLGKSVSRKFAARYVEAVAPCINFVASELLQDLCKEGRPWSKALAYDRSVALGDFTPVEIPDINGASVELTLAEDSDSVRTFQRKFNTLRFDICDILEEFTLNNTIKTGDIILLDTLHPLLQLDSESRGCLELRASIPSESNPLKINIR